MNEQMDWLAEASFSRTVTHPPRARRADPLTSQQAADRADTFVAGHEAKVFGAIRDAGEKGATAKEIARETGLNDVQVNRRLGAMGERKLITRRLNDQPKGERDFISRGGCAVWWKA